MSGYSPYNLYDQQRQMGGYGGMGGAYGGGYGSRYGGGYPGMPRPGEEPSPNTTMHGTDNPSLDQARLQQQIEGNQARGVATAAGNLVAAQGDQARSIAAYRTANNNSQGAMANRETTQEARSFGIDPSLSATDVANAASGPTTFDANGMPRGAGTAQAVQPNEADLRNAVVTQQAAKDGGQVATQAGAYAAGANRAMGLTPTGASPFPPAPSPMAGAPKLSFNLTGTQAPAGAATAPRMAASPTPYPPTMPQALKIAASGAFQAPHPTALGVGTPRPRPMPSSISSAFSPKQRQPLQAF